MHALSTFLLFLLLLHAHAQSACHYSCATCVGESYTLCVSCNGTATLTVVEDPAECDSQYLNSNVPTGACTGKVPTGVNQMGVLILLICIGMGVVTRTKQSFYLISTLQSLALISFVEVAWLSPSNYLLQSLQYFMVFNLLGYNFKTPDTTMLQRQYYRLDAYFQQSELSENLIPIAIINLIVFVLMVILAVRQYRSQKREAEEMRMELASGKSDRQVAALTDQQKWEMKSTADKVLSTLFKILLITFYFLIQETCLTILVSLRFQNPKIAPIALGVLYALAMLCYMAYLVIQPVWFFPNPATQYVNIWRKLVVPVFVIVPVDITFLIIILLLIFGIVESFFDFKGGDFKLMSRISLYKLLQILVVISCLAYFLTESSQNDQFQTKVINAFVTLFILAFFLCIVFEFIFGSIETYCLSNQVTNASELSENRAANINQNETQQNIDPNIFTHHHQEIQIYDIEDEDQKDVKRNSLGETHQREEEQAKRRSLEEIRIKTEADEKKKQEKERIRREKQEKRRELQEKRRRQQQERLRILEQERRKKREEELRKLREQEQYERKLREEEEQRLKEEKRRRQEERKMRQQEERLRKEEEEKWRKEELERKKKLEEERRMREQLQQQRRLEQARQEKRKLQEEQRRRKEEERLRREQKKRLEQEEQKRLEEEQNARKKRELEEMIRKKKQEEEARRKAIQEEEERMRIQEEQEEEKRRKKRQYKAQMDPELRKRYGL